MLFIEDVDRVSKDTTLLRERREVLKNLVDEDGVSGPVWLEYLGGNHRFYDQGARPDPNLTEKLDQNENYAF